jgi:hypothetical protein
VDLEDLEDILKVLGAAGPLRSVVYAKGDARVEATFDAPEVAVSAQGEIPSQPRQWARPSFRTGNE